VFPSRWYETFGLVVAEAMAAGLPVVVPDGGPAAEVAGAAGVRIRLEAGVPSPDSIADSLASLVDDQAVDARGAAARARFRVRFAPDQAASALVRAYVAAGAGQATVRGTPCAT
jgi:glycosyltransferase involved in cell wall biosynthesis